MFFRRETPKNPSFAERVEKLKGAGFSVTPEAGGAVRVTRGEVGMALAEGGTARAGVLMGNEIGALVDGGYQKFFRTPTGQTRPATAELLRDLHDFEADLKEAMGQDSLYNEALGTVSTHYLYDRVKDRDHGVPKRAWE
jgi:hypothetical protein